MNTNETTSSAGRFSAVSYKFAQEIQRDESQMIGRLFRIGKSCVTYWATDFCILMLRMPMTVTSTATN